MVIPDQTSLHMKTRENALKLDILTAFGEFKPLEERINFIPPYEDSMEDEEVNEAE